MLCGKSVVNIGYKFRASHVIKAFHFTQRRCFKNAKTDNRAGDAFTLLFLWCHHDAAGDGDAGGKVFSLHISHHTYNLLLLMSEASAKSF